MPTWPSTLPTPLRDQYSFEAMEGTVRTEMESGKPRVRRAFTDTPMRANVKWRFTQAQLAIFETFHKHTLDEGTAVFDMTMLNGKGATVWQVQFASQYSVAVVGGNRFDVTATLFGYNRPVDP